MAPSSCREVKLEERMRCFRCPAPQIGGRKVILSLILLASIAQGCSGPSKQTNANSAGSTSNSQGNGNANATAGGTRIDFKDPERYSVSMTISAQSASTVDPAAMATQQFGFAKMGADRRWTFVLPGPLGQTAYLEKSGLKYLVFFDRKLYVEIPPDTLGFQPGTVLTPTAAAGRLNSRAQYEQLGVDSVNGRTAIRYRVNPGGDDSSQTHGILFVDQETGLPLRCELNISASAGTNLRVIVETRDVQLNPDRLLFDVPAGMKKITPQEAKSQIAAVASALHLFADIMTGKQTAPIPGAAARNDNRNGAARDPAITRKQTGKTK